MSRVGKKVIELPDKVTVEYDSKTNTVTVKGALGELSRQLYRDIKLQIDGNNITLTVKNPDDKFQRAIWGTSRAIVQNMVDGVSKGFNKEVELNGVGYKMELAGNTLTLYIGYSHSVKVDVPTGIKLTLNKNLLTGTSINKELIGNFFSTIHNMKPADPYKHKGFKFPGRFYRKKVVKKTK